MRFASLASAFILSLLILTPLKHVVRYLAGQGAAGGLMPGLAYLAILVLLWVVLTGVFWSVRRWLVFADAWASSGLAGLDRGVHGQWALVWCLPLSMLLLVCAALWGGEERPTAIIEAIGASASALIALLGPPPEANPVDEYDPLPLPAPSPEPAPPLPSPEPPLTACG